MKYPSWPRDELSSQNSHSHSYANKQEGCPTLYDRHQPSTQIFNRDLSRCCLESSSSRIRPNQYHQRVLTVTRRLCARTGEDYRWEYQRSDSKWAMCSGTGSRMKEWMELCVVSDRLVCERSSFAGSLTCSVLNLERLRGRENLVLIGRVDEVQNIALAIPFSAILIVGALRLTKPPSWEVRSSRNPQ